MWKEFKDFIMKGNVLDLAVAVILAGAFGAVVSSFVADILMPPIGQVLGGVDFKDLAFVIEPAVLGADGKVVAEAVAIRYGKWIQTLIDFLIIAFVIFNIVRAYNKTQKPAEAAAPAGPSDNDLLTEIRDLLKR